AGMAETPETEGNGICRTDARMSAPDVKAWFVREVLPLEGALMQFLHHNWRKANDLPDLRQEVYARVCEAARSQIPHPVKPFVFAIARNLLIDRVRREQIVPIDAVSDLDALAIAADVPGPDRAAIARDELRRLQAALDELPPRCREIVVLARIEGFSGREIAARMGISDSAVSQQLDHGMRALADALYGAVRK
ncbi:MAG TPA: sigma-70 family RNA polymerase sigma factor, partial [Rhizomicrobium sp.]|nr:sigma-70 family RNA polymerase sigma factor [Rhizomicrobium sp.]